MTLEQAKHIANSLRVIGMAQFATYGYTELHSQQTYTLVIAASAVAYLALEAISLKMLGNAL